MGGQAVSLALAAPHPSPLRGATLPVKGRDGSPMSSTFFFGVDADRNI